MFSGKIPGVQLNQWMIKKQLVPIMVMMAVTITGCSQKSQISAPTTDYEEQEIDQAVDRTADQSPEIKRITAIFNDIYEEASNDHTTEDIDAIQNIIDRLGRDGYSAVDSENQMDMTNADKVVSFCEQVDAKEKADLTIIVILYNGGFKYYYLGSEEGNVDITESYYQYENGTMNNISIIRYAAESWQYTEDGYLLFAGSWFSEEYYAYSLDNVDEYIAIRVRPLESRCRELNRKYILPIGYGQNNIFLTDWNEEDFGTLNFYDLYDVFYKNVNEQFVPYTVVDHGIPKDQFEAIIMTHMNIDSQTIQSKTTYLPENMIYEYRPRGSYEAEADEVPYPEVVDYEEHEDGTITLTVQALFPGENTSKLFVHEVVVRPLEEDKFQYVSNRMITPIGSSELWWHKERMNREEWIENYGEAFKRQE